MKKKLVRFMEGLLIFELFFLHVCGTGRGRYTSRLRQHRTPPPEDSVIDALRFHAPMEDLSSFFLDPQPRPMMHIVAVH